MTRHLLWLILLGLFILQGSIVVWLIPSAWQSSVHVTPHFTLVFILFIGLFHHRHSALIYGLLFGLLHDFNYYGAMLGVYSFGMGLTGYLAGLAQRRQPNLIFYNLLIIGVGLLLFEFIDFGINHLFKLIDIELKFALTHYMLPSVLFNLLFALICYVPIRKLLEGKRIVPANTED
ncbi:MULTISPECIES: rod shape-determining protein MreD [Paenibacillus]|uniref:Rod shape-determining protein MreD n=2 Tax=Paenibacillus TaxID=44249 RepID=A0ABU6DAQ4_9BACL|nr:MULTISPECIES: rod shape-determining protein MreD [Paenibacillus]MBA2939300.1 rod shape-determining protein MreD [Paenibacillus sp. CGMCC 1.16610]MCY9658998.1 rod shape-determining protein MreD [Paenibacillus anseongense]MEB4794834.1 rod shape-determining protein MreD [Paenibacillus chondroitinus]MVQ35259.1 rod shape-determining protein MreD [Paenibacillus anseongense]